MVVFLVTTALAVVAEVVANPKKNLNLRYRFFCRVQLLEFLFEHLYILENYNKCKRGGFILYSLKNRISAFVFLEDTFVQAPSHSQCVMNILIGERIIRSEDEYYHLMKQPNTQKQLQQIIKEIENRSVFGELTLYKGRLAIIVFDELSSYGIYTIKNATKGVMGDLPIYYLNLNEDSKNKHLKELHG